MTAENSSLILIQYLDKEILEKICHRVADTLFANQEPIGVFTDHNPAIVDSCLAQPQQQLFGRDIYPDLYTKGAVLYYLLNRNHPFGNGNKRMSAASLVVFLYLNNRYLAASKDEFRDLTLKVAEDTRSIDVVVPELAEWIRTHIAMREDGNEDSVSGV